MTTTTNKMKHMTPADASSRLSRMTEEARMRLKKRGGELLEDAQDKSERAIRSTRGWITRNPGAAVGYAFLAGAVTTALIRRRKKE